jgi:hypothetical protein
MNCNDRPRVKPDHRQLRARSLCSCSRLLLPEVISEILKLPMARIELAAAFQRLSAAKRPSYLQLNADYSKFTKRDPVTYWRLDYNDTPHYVFGGLSNCRKIRQRTSYERSDIAVQITCHLRCDVAQTAALLDTMELPGIHNASESSSILVESGPIPTLPEQTHRRKAQSRCCSQLQLSTPCKACMRLTSRIAILLQQPGQYISNTTSAT